jgi:hypothetical protein
MIIGNMVVDIDNDFSEEMVGFGYPISSLSFSSVYKNKHGRKNLRE